MVVMKAGKKNACKMVGSPSLLRHYPDSTVQRTSRHPGRPSLTLADRRLVGTPHHRRGFPCFTGLPMHACCRHYPGGIVGCICRSLHQRWQPSLYSRQVGFRIALFEACSAFTLITACTLAESLNDPLHRRLRRSRYLLHLYDCYRLERPLPGRTDSYWVTVPLHGALEIEASRISPPQF
jgi:hypothetical protein